MSRLLVALLLLGAGCPLAADDGGGCELDTECTGGVCARDRSCRPASDVRAVTVQWTVNGEPASEVTCQPSPRLYLQFLGRSAGEELTYTPVPCELGQFLIDKLPLEYGLVEIGPQGSGRAQLVNIRDNAAIVDLDLGR